MRQPDAAEAVLAAVGRFEHWRQMLQSLADSGPDTGGTARAVRRADLPPRTTSWPPCPRQMRSAAWTGPTGRNQDFQLPGAAIEVKTSSGKEPQTIVISSERELDDTGTGRLILAHFSLDERRGGSGESLNTLVDRTRAAVTDAAARSLLDDLLVRAGYLRAPARPVRRAPVHRPQAALLARHRDFPRITEADLRPGVGDCEYRISTAGLEQYAHDRRGCPCRCHGRQPG